MDFCQYILTRLWQRYYILVKVVDLLYYSMAYSFSATAVTLAPRYDQEEAYREVEGIDCRWVTYRGTRIDCRTVCYAANRIA